MIPRLIGAVLSIAVVAGGFKIVRSQMNESSDIARNATEQAEKIRKDVENVQSNAQKQAEEIQKDVTDATEAGIWEKSDYQKGYEGIVEKLANDKDIMKLQLTTVTIEVTARVGKTQRAHGFQYNSATSQINPVEVTISGDGDIKNSVFALSTINFDLPAKLAAKVRKAVGDPKAKILSMTLERPLIQTANDSAPKWIIPVETNGRSHSYTAKIDGSGFKKNG